MLRDFAALFRALAIAIAIAAVPLAACGIKGPLRPASPPAATATPDAPPSEPPAASSPSGPERKP